MKKFIAIATLATAVHGAQPTCQDVYDVYREPQATGETCCQNTAQSISRTALLKLVNGSIYDVPQTWGNAASPAVKAFDTAGQHFLVGMHYSPLGLTYGHELKVYNIEQRKGHIVDLKHPTGFSFNIFAALEVYNGFLYISGLERTALIDSQEAVAQGGDSYQTVCRVPLADLLTGSEVTVSVVWRGATLVGENGGWAAFNGVYDSFLEGSKMYIWSAGNPWGPTPHRYVLDLAETPVSAAALPDFLTPPVDYATGKGAHFVTDAEYIGDRFVVGGQVVDFDLQLYADFFAAGTPVSAFVYELDGPGDVHNTTAADITYLPESGYMYVKVGVDRYMWTEGFTNNQWIMNGNLQAEDRTPLPFVRDDVSMVYADDVALQIVYTNGAYKKITF